MKLHVMQLSKTVKLDANNLEQEIYRCVLQGVEPDAVAAHGIKAKLTLEAANQIELEQFVEQRMGEEVTLILKVAQSKLSQYDRVDDPKQTKLPGGE